jgi:hypothetical protein
MLDGKRYYAAFPDEDPVLRLRIAAVHRALGKVEKLSENEWNHFEPKSSRRRMRRRSLLDESR